MPVICGKSDYFLQWHHKVRKNTPRLMERKRENERKHYAQNRKIILYKMKMKRLEKNPNPRKYNRKKPLKEYSFDEEPKFRKRRGYYEPIIHLYPKNRRSMKRMCSDGYVV